jgi:hypothetical protein
MDARTNALLDKDRLFPPDPTTRAIARELYAEIRALPIVSPARPHRSALVCGDRRSRGGGAWARRGNRAFAHPTIIEGVTPVLLSRPFDEALLYAADIHRMQVRKGTDIPYIAHLLSVTGWVLTNGGTEAQAIAALLHDSAEDQGGERRLEDIRRRFGPDVAEIVADCTDAWVEPKPEWRQRKEAYLVALPHKPETSLLVSLGDKIDNAAAILRDYHRIGDDIWKRFTGGRSGSIWYYRSLSAVFCEIMPAHLSDQLSRLVAEFPESGSA